MNPTQRELAEGIRVPYQRVDETINRERGITPDTALRLAKHFGNTEGFWMTLQLRGNLHQASEFGGQGTRKDTPSPCLVRNGGPGRR